MEGKNQMGPENIDKIVELFRKPLGEVAQNIAISYVWHEDRKKVLNGQGAIFVLQTPTSARRFRLEEAVLYSHEYTMSRWPNSRGPEIAVLNPGEIIGYQFHQYFLPFGKVGEIGSAANIQLSKFQEVDNYGEPMKTKEAEIGGVKLFRYIGLKDRSLAHLTPVDFRGKLAFLVSAGARELSAEELKQLEEEILKFTL